MITQVLDYYSHNTRSKETIRSMRTRTRTGDNLDLLIVHCQTEIPFQKTEDVYLIIPLIFHYLNILNLNRFT